jgi:hypothetical protein
MNAGDIVSWISKSVIIGIVIIACILDLLHNRKPPNKYQFKFIVKRFLNWISIGLLYAVSYMGRYNINILNTSYVHFMLGVSISEYGIIITGGFIVYAVFVVINGLYLFFIHFNVFIYLFII